MLKEISVKENSHNETLTIDRKRYLLSKALYYGVKEISERPEREREFSNMDDMKYIYNKLLPIFRNVKFSLEKGGKRDSFKKAVRFATGPRGHYIQAQALYLAIKYLEAKNDAKDTEDIRDMKTLLDSSFSGFYGVFVNNDMIRDFLKEKAHVESGDSDLISQKLAEYRELNNIQTSNN
jgi:hypothetical protein